MRPRITVVTLGADDLERAVAFYRDGLGLSTEGIIGTEFDHGAVAFFDLEGGLKLALWPRTSLAHDTGLATSPASPTDLSPATLATPISSRRLQMSAMSESAKAFFEACETGKGWDVCRQFRRPDATFSAQASALADVRTLEAYTNWMKGLFTPVPDGRYELRSFAVDEARGNVTAYAVFRGTHTGEGGPVPPTGRAVEADYVYVMDFEGDSIRHMTKIWNDGASLRQLGWM